MLTRLLTAHLRDYRWPLLLIVLLQSVQAMALLTLPTINASIIDTGIANNDTGYIVRMGVIMLGVTFVQVCFAIAATYVASRVAMGFGRDVRDGLFHQVTGFAGQEVDQFGAPSLITRITNDVTQVQMLVVMGLTMLVVAPIMATGAVIMAVNQDGALSLILVVSIPVLLLGVVSIIVRLIPLFQVMQERLDRVNEVLREQLAGMRVVRSFVREPFEANRFGTANDELTDTSLKAGRLVAFMFPTVMLVVNLSSAGALWLGAGRIEDGDLQIGSLIAFLSYLVQILMAVMMATFVAILAPRAKVSAERIQEVLGTPSSIAIADDPVTGLPSRAVLGFDDVGFRYPGAEEPVLCNLSLTAEPGQTTAIIGSTGAGKTTLVNLVPRLFDVTDGTVRIGGADVRDLAPEELWQQVGLVPQRPFLFSGTVATNLRHADPDATDDQLWEALRIAQAADFVQEMPGGLAEPINQGGTNVSGGQRQRLAIARAVVHRPGIYIFDDSFSALDLATDAHLREALAPVTADAVVLTVAQRVSTIMHADQILVLENGREAGLGTHGELLATCPTYREIVDSQMSAEEAA